MGQEHAIPRLLSIGLPAMAEQALPARAHTFAHSPRIPSQACIVSQLSKFFFCAPRTNLACRSLGGGRGAVESDAASGLPRRRDDNAFSAAGGSSPPRGRSLRAVASVAWMRAREPGGRARPRVSAGLCGGSQHRPAGRRAHRAPGAGPRSACVRRTLRERSPRTADAHVLGPAVTPWPGRGPMRSSSPSCVSVRLAAAFSTLPVAASAGRGGRTGAKADGRRSGGEQAPGRQSAQGGSARSECTRRPAAHHRGQRGSGGRG
jgi:hypothetical protein